MSPKSDNPYRLEEEVYELPVKLGMVVSLLTDILLKPGKVQEISVKVGHPVRVKRLTRDDPVVERKEMGRWDLIRNGRLVEVAPASAPDAIYEMLRLLAAEGLVPNRFVTGNAPVLLNPWAGVSVVDQHLCIPVERDEEVPNNVLLLLGTPRHDSPSHQVMLTVKTTMVVEDRYDDLVGAGVVEWSDPQGSGVPVGETGVPGEG